jgi:hypothetical protein
MTDEIKTYGQIAREACAAASDGKSLVSGADLPPLPGWPVMITQQPAMDPERPGYSALLTIEAPEGTRLAVPGE